MEENGVAEVGVRQRVVRSDQNCLLFRVESRIFNLRAFHFQASAPWHYNTGFFSYNALAGGVLTGSSSTAIGS